PRGPPGRPDTVSTISVGSWSLPWGRGLGGPLWQSDCTRCAPPGGAVQFDLASVGGDDAPGDAQAEAGAAPLPAAGLVHTVEAVEHMGQVFGRNPLSRVSDRDHSGLAPGLDLHLDL